MRTSAQAAPPGRLSRAVAGTTTFDVETEALCEDPPIVRTYVFASGRIIDRVVWPLVGRDARALEQLINLQHERVLQKIAESDKSPVEGDAEMLVIGDLVPPEMAPLSSKLVRFVKGPPASISPIKKSERPPVMVSDSSPLQEGVVIDEEATVLQEIGNAGPELAELAFLACGLEELLVSHLDLGACKGIAFDRQGKSILVVRGHGLCCALVVPPRVPASRVMALARETLSRVAETMS